MNGYKLFCMDTITTMPATIHKCGICNTNLQSKRMIREHRLICNIKHSFYKEQKDPSHFELIEYIIRLSDRYDKLEQKVDKLQKTIFQLRKKNVDDYIKTLPPASATFSDWISKCVVTEKGLKTLFERDFKECLKGIITQTLEDTMNSPLKSFVQRPQTIFIYDKSLEDPTHISWRVMTEDEIAYFTRVLCHRISKKYTEWTLDHEYEIESNQKMQELSMIYLNKSNGSSMKTEQKIQEVKKTIIANIQVSLKNLE